METIERRLRVHAFPALDTMPLSAIKPSTLQSWVKGLSSRLAPATVTSALSTVTAVLSAAVDDGLLRVNPAAALSVRAPAIERRRVMPWTHDDVLRIIDAHPQRWAAVPVLAAGTGMRQGEVFAVSVGSCSANCTLTLRSRWSAAA